MKTIIVPVKQKNAVELAAKALHEGKAIIYPTETSYGIGCDAQNKKAVQMVHKIKKEPSTKPLIILVPDLLHAKKIAQLSQTDQALAKKFMPGPLTLVVQKRKGKLKGISGGTAAFRISSNRFAFLLSKKFGGAITSTSANLHGEKPIFDAKKIIEAFDEKVGLIIDAGILPKQRPSTIYDSKNKKILRKGKILLAHLLKVQKSVEK